jgi:hypothetical protein
MQEYSYIVCHATDTNMYIYQAVQYMHMVTRKNTEHKSNLTTI